MAVAAQHDLIAKFTARYPNSGEPAIYRAPGRVNLIGEHTDYNLGFVLPVAIDLACDIAAAPNSTGQLRLYSEDLVEGFEVDTAALASAQPRHHWSDYIVGVAQQLLRAGVNVKPADLLIRSTVPVGSGLSSSAALEVSAALALSGNAVHDRRELVKMCHRAENEFVGVPSGVMDQFISVFGKTQRAIKLDCRSLELEEVPLPDGIAILAVNSMVKHEHGTGAYRQRVAECAEAVASIRRKHPEVASLRDASEQMLADVTGVPLKRARHVITENHRVVEFAAAARNGDRVRMGELFVGSHRSMQHDYQISCAEIDFLVDTAVAMPGVFGARMTGGGFGGCTVNLIEASAAAAFREAIVAAYHDRYQITPLIYDCSPSEGAAQIFP